MPGPSDVSMVRHSCVMAESSVVYFDGQMEATHTVAVHWAGLSFMHKL